MTQIIFIPLVVASMVLVPIWGLTYSFDGSVLDISGTLRTPCHELDINTSIINETNWRGEVIEVAYISIGQTSPKTACPEIPTPFDEQILLDVDKLIIDGQDIWIR